MDSCPMCSKWHDEPNLRVAELEHCRVMLNGDQFFPGYTFVFTRSHVTELFHLDQAIRTGVMEEVSAVAAALYKLFHPDKINYELLGNMVPHIHWHLIPRFAQDPLWPRPIWSEPHREVVLGEKEYTERISSVREALSSAIPPQRCL
ncbi:HIT family protein [Geotalea sp. SG265]|uniref:HIT family protein n=1 Tax=Geotalea sp. SG265 TaxID=2922867 RepID=UPI001FAF8C2C|nr:HIT family protein [Geotalea sp. SG265]